MAGSAGRGSCDCLWAGLEPNAGGADSGLRRREWRLSSQFQYVLRPVRDGVASDRQPDRLFVHDNDSGPGPCHRHNCKGNSGHFGRVSGTVHRDREGNSHGWYGANRRGLCWNADWCGGLLQRHFRDALAQPLGGLRRAMSMSGNSPAPSVHLLGVRDGDAHSPRCDPGAEHRPQHAPLVREKDVDLDGLP